MEGYERQLETEETISFKFFFQVQTSIMAAHEVGPPRNPFTDTQPESGDKQPALPTRSIHVPLHPPHHLLAGDVFLLLLRHDGGRVIHTTAFSTLPRIPLSPASAPFP